ncbi:MAG: hypothetical protein ACKO8Q_01780, partial [Bacteroidota bacterium]
MKKLFFSFALLFSLNTYAQNSIENSANPLEIRLYKSEASFHFNNQSALANSQAWKVFSGSHSKWSAVFSEQTGMPVKAFGKPFSVEGASDIEKATNFVESLKLSFGNSEMNLVFRSESKGAKHTQFNFDQTYQGHRVLFSKVNVKLVNGNVAQFAFGAHPNIELTELPLISLDAAAANATAGVIRPVENLIVNEDEIFVLPVPTEQGMTYHYVYQVNFKTTSEQQIPEHYLCYVDAENGTLYFRKNLVSHAEGGPVKPNNDEEVVTDVQVNGNLYLDNPYGTITTSGLSNIYITQGGTEYQTNLTGGGTINANPGAAVVKLEGPWSSVNTGGVIPQKNVTLTAGLNTIDMSTAANIQELSAYLSVNRIHDHCKFWMPSFTGMDFQLPTNIDLTTGDCNAFYDGSSINFYAIGNGCNATSLIADVVFHEYGHGINDNYYQSEGSFFMNGAIGEGYADYWAVSLGDNPVIGVGFYTDNQDGIRRYDTERKVYPQDLVGEVHADGEIIMGAWYDTHVLMGGDWNLTMPLFIEAYSGLQAEAADGNEGEA